VICRVSTGAGENRRKEGGGCIKKMKISDRITGLTGYDPILSKYLIETEKNTYIDI